MKTLIVIFFIGGLSNLFGQVDSNKVLTLTFYHGIKLNKIPLPGNRFIFKQFCTTQIDSVISSGNLKMKGSRIGKIKNCLYQMEIRDDTLRTVIIETNKKNNTKQLLSQATTQFGNPTEINNNGTTIFEWNSDTEKSNIITKLTIDAELKTGTMTIKK